MPANLFTNYLCFARTPTALKSAVVLPLHLLCYALLELVPGLSRVVGSALGMAFVDSMGVLDNMTTGLNYLEESHAAHGSVVLAIACGMCVNVAGGIGRHFYAKGLVPGTATFDATLLPAVRFSLCVNTLYVVALRACDGDSACVDQRFHLYPLLPWAALIRNLLPLLVSLVSRKEKRA